MKKILKIKSERAKFSACKKSEDYLA